MKYFLATYISKAFLAILDWDLVKKSQVIFCMRVLRLLLYILCK
jgi:hypothetical protein